VHDREVLVDNSSSAVLISLYRKRAKRYDRSTLLLYLAGFHHWAYRKRAVESLALCQGDTVVDLGCGTGLNFSLLQARVGQSGKIIGVDLTDAMLDQAAERVAANGWSNVELVKSDAAKYAFPSGLEGILSTFALTLVPDFDEVVRNGALALAQGKRFVVLDFKRPSGWLMNRAAPLLAKLLTGPFGERLRWLRESRGCHWRGTWLPSSSQVCTWAGLTSRPATSPGPPKRCA
jgi:ubiquinone/menaquinone biosynthesis C-methylase UbiE